MTVEMQQKIKRLEAEVQALLARVAELERLLAVLTTKKAKAA